MKIFRTTCIETDAKTDIYRLIKEAESATPRNEIPMLILNNTLYIIPYKIQNTNKNQPTKIADYTGNINIWKIEEELQKKERIASKGIGKNNTTDCYPVVLIRRDGRHKKYAVMSHATFLYTRIG